MLTSAYLKHSAQPLLKHGHRRFTIASMPVLVHVYEQHQLRRYSFEQTALAEALSPERNMLTRGKNLTLGLKHASARYGLQRVSEP